MPGTAPWIPRTCKICGASGLGKWKSYCDPCRLKVESECSHRCRLQNLEARRKHDNDRYPIVKAQRDLKRGKLTDAELEERFAAREILNPERPPDELWLMWDDLRRIEKKLYGPRRMVPLEALMSEYR